MIKYRTTDREQKENNCFILGFSYCSIQNIEKYLKPNAYTCGVYGWRANFYNFDGWSISTGYAPISFIYKSGFKDIDAYRTKEAEILRRELLKLEKRLDKNFYKWQKNGSWHNTQKQFNKIFERIVNKAHDEANKAAAEFRK